MADIAELMRGALEAFRPPEKLTLSEWADRYAFLSAESSAEAGRWHTLPYQKGMMDAVTDPAVEQITVIEISACWLHQDDQPRDWLSRPSGRLSDHGCAADC